jgi:hypothetical protein
MVTAKIIDHVRYEPPNRWIVEFDGQRYEVHTWCHPYLEIEAIYAIVPHEGSGLNTMPSSFNMDDRLIKLEDLVLGTEVFYTITEACSEAIEDKINDLNPYALPLP